MAKKNSAAKAKTVKDESPAGQTNLERRLTTDLANLSEREVSLIIEVAEKLQAEINAE